MTPEEISRFAQMLEEADRVRARIVADAAEASEKAEHDDAPIAAA